MRLWLCGWQEWRWEAILFSYYRRGFSNGNKSTSAVAISKKAVAFES
jgi:hypothetical protein